MHHRSPSKYEAWAITYAQGGSRPYRSVRCFGMKVWEQRQYQKPRIISVWRNPSLEDGDLEQMFFRQVRHHADSRQGALKTNPDAYDLSRYHMSIYHQFRQLDCDIQQLINLLLRRGFRDDELAQAHQWDLVSLREVPGGMATSTLCLSQRSRWPEWRWGKDHSMSEFRLILRNVHT